VTPDLPVDGLRLNWKVGAFMEKSGMAGKFDAGPYDTYMFGRTHHLGEALALQYDVGDFTLKLEHGFGAHLEMVPAGISLGGSQISFNYAAVGPMRTPVDAYPPGASPGFASAVAGDRRGAEHRACAPEHRRRAVSRRRQRVRNQGQHVVVSAAGRDEAIFPPDVDRRRRRSYRGKEPASRPRWR
jgi:hypothetical protein